MRMLVFSLAALLALCVCDSSDEGSPGTFRNGIPGLTKGGKMSEARSSPRDGQCPSDAPVVCRDVCCAEGEQCNDGCIRPPFQPSSPVGGQDCQSAPCLGGVCIAGDSGIFSNDAMVTDPAAFVPGKFGNGVSPNGVLSTDCQSNPTPPDIVASASQFPGVGEALTVEVWVQASGSDTSGDQVLLAYRQTNPDMLWALVLTDTELRFEQGTTTHQICERTASLHDDVWHHVAVTATGDQVAPLEAEVAMYLDGVMLGIPCAFVNFSPDLDLPESTSAYIGQQPPAPEYGSCYEPLQGSLDEIRVTRRVLTPIEIAEDATRELSPDDDVSMTAVLWHFDDQGEYCCDAGYDCGTKQDCIPQGCSGENCVPIPPADCVCPPDAPLTCDANNCCGFGSWCVEIAEGEFVCRVADADADPIPDKETGCMFSHPVPCGEVCCLFDAPCKDGSCGCPPKTTMCGALCCSEGLQCVEGRCQADSPCPDPDYPEECGDSQCCADEFPCVDGSCVCGGEYPIACGPFCCLPGASCEPYTGDFCDCPSGRARCGFMDLYCCDEGQVCKDGKCMKGKPPDNTCPGGWMGSTQSCGALGIDDPCTCIGETTTCITKTEYEEGTGLPFPTSCAQEGTTGCILDDGRLAMPCCPGLSCVYRDRCGGEPGGICKEYQE